MRRWSSQSWPGRKQKNSQKDSECHAHHAMQFSYLLAWLIEENDDR